MASLISNYIIIVSISGVLNALLALFAFYRKTDFSGLRAFIVRLRRLGGVHIRLRARALGELDGTD